MRRGGIGIGTLVVLALVGWALGVESPPSDRRSGGFDRWPAVAAALLLRHVAAG